MKTSGDLTPGAATRALGAALAGAISFGFALVLAAFAEAGGLGVVDSGLLAFVALGAAIGVPVGVLLGWIFTPTALLNGDRMRLDLVVRLATIAVLLGAAMVAVTMTFDNLVSGGTTVTGLIEASAYTGILIVVGLLYFGVPAWVLAAVVSTAWVIVVRAVANHERSHDADAIASIQR